jgi:hypothetical protein
MGLGPLLRRIKGHWVGRIGGRSGARHRRRGRLARYEWLESRLALAAGISPVLAILMDSATTTDSRSVIAEYDLGAPPDAAHPLAFSVYRSADNRLDAADILLGTEAIVPPGQGTPTLDLDGKPAAAPGHHRIDIPLPDGLPPNPKHPYVLVAADPEVAVASGDPRLTASFRKYVIGVVTHGGLQNKHWRNGPPWELKMATSLRWQGYDAVIPYNWVSQSSQPGAAAKQGRRLAHMVLQAASWLPPSDPVDLHIIGHSEGTVVNSQAILALEREMTPQLQAGYLKLTMLDPHAANTGIPGEQYSTVGGPLGWLAKGTIDSYQSKAKDPAVVVPPGVDDAEVFYQHTNVSRAPHGDIYNIWGQVPVRGPAHYFDLTADKATHSGKTGVAAWYQYNVVPTLGDGDPWVRSQILTGAQVPPVTAAADPIPPAGRATYAGKAAPGSTVRLFASPAASPSELRGIGQTVTDTDGRWSATTDSLKDGRYRVVAVSSSPPRRAIPRLAMKPTEPLGLLVIGANGGA